jgi:hypothetical protein
MDLQLMQRAVAQGKVVLGGDGLAFSLFFGGDTQIQGDGHEDDPLVTPAARESKWIKALLRPPLPGPALKNSLREGRHLSCVWRAPE